ncbi:MAG: glutathione S-transferase family protein [Bdellovibrionales bacterium]
MIRIYGLHTPMFMKVVYAAEELGLNYQINPVDLTKGETKTAEHLARHPFGKVPVIEHDGRFLFESNAIVRYFGGLDSTAAYPSQKMDRAQVDQWMEFFSHQAGRWTTSVWFQKCIGPKYFNEKPDEKVVAETTKWLLEAMPVIDKKLSETAFLAGERFTLADLVAHTLMMCYKEADLPLSEFKNFVRWFEAVEQRPAFKRTLAAVEKVEKKL